MTYVNIDDPHDDRLICNDCGHVDLWDEQEKLANECGQRSKPKYRVERYGNKTKGPGFKKIIWNKIKHRAFWPCGVYGKGGHQK